MGLLLLRGEHSVVRACATGRRDASRDAAGPEAVSPVQHQAGARQSAKYAWDAWDAVRQDEALVVERHLEPSGEDAERLAGPARAVLAQAVLQWDVEALQQLKLEAQAALEPDIPDVAQFAAQSCAEKEL